MDKLEQAKQYLQIANSPEPKRRLAELAADCIIAAHQQNPSLTLRDLTRRLSAGEVWQGHDETWLEGLVTWRRHELALQNGAEKPTFVTLAEADDAA